MPICELIEVIKTTEAGLLKNGKSAGTRKNGPLGDAGGQKKVVETIRQAFGTLDVLFLNAGIVDMRPLEQWDDRIRSLV